MDPALTAAAIGVGGTVIVGVAGFLASVRNTNKTTALTLRAVELTEQGQVTDRYTKAIEQLGSDKLDVRIGGIYALERIARDSARDLQSIVNVLSAFIRGQAEELIPPARPTAPSDAAEIRQRKRPDVQAAARVIGSRDPQRELPPIDLCYANLIAAPLSDARFVRTIFIRTNLSYAELCRANFASADLSYANLTKADLANARLGSAHLDGADLTRANLNSANLNCANLDGANLDGANLDGANLDGANLTGARWPSDTPVPVGWQRDTDSGRLQRAARDSGDAAAK